MTLTSKASVLFLSFLTAMAAAVAEPALKIAVNSTTIESFPVFAAVDAMPASAAGASVQLIPAANGRIAMSQLVGATADAATGSETQALLNSVAEPRIRIILTLAECRYRIVARRSAGISRAADLRGKKVAVTINTSSHYFLNRMLRNAGLNESDVQVVGLEGQEMPAALARHTVDAVAIWEPHAENSLQALGKDNVILEDPAAYIERFNLNTRTDVLANPAKRQALVALVREIARASARLRSRPPDLIRSLAPKISLPDRTVMAVWPQFSFPASISEGLGAALDQVEPWVAAMQKRAPQSGNNLAALIDRTVLEQALK